jgi:hypothetical protein
VQDHQIEQPIVLAEAEAKVGKGEEETTIFQGAEARAAKDKIEVQEDKIKAQEDEVALRAVKEPQIMRSIL